MAANQHDLLIVYTSKNGRTGAMVEPISQGMEDAGASVAVRTVEQVQWEEMLSAKGVIIWTPVRFGDVDWQIKRLFDVTAFQDYPRPFVGQGWWGVHRGRPPWRRRRTGPAQHDSHPPEPRDGHPRPRP